MYLCWTSHPELDSHTRAEICHWLQFIYGLTNVHRYKPRPVPSLPCTRANHDAETYYFVYLSKIIAINSRNIPSERTVALWPSTAAFWLAWKWCRWWDFDYIHGILLAGGRMREDAQSSCMGEEFPVIPLHFVTRELILLVLCHVRYF